MTLAVADWSRDHENDRSLRMARIHLAIESNRHDTDMHRAIVKEPDGALLRGCWCWMVDLAGRSPLRGALLTQRGTAHDSTSMAAAVGGQVSWFTRAVEFFLGLGRLLHLSFSHDGPAVPCGTGIVPVQFACQLSLPQMLEDGWVAYDTTPSRARARGTKKEEKPPSSLPSSQGGRRPRSVRGPSGLVPDMSRTNSDRSGRRPDSVRSEAPDPAAVAAFGQAHGISLGEIEAWSLERASSGWAFPSGRNWKQDLWRWRQRAQEGATNRYTLPFEERNPPEVVQACIREMRARAAQGGRP